MSISTLSLNTSTLSTLMRLKQQAADAATESTTERHVDVGLTLGRLTGTAVNYRIKESSFEEQLQTNQVIAGRLNQSYTLMGSVNDTATSISSSLLSAEKYSSYPELAKSALQQMQSSLNQSVGDLFIFGGKNADAGPIKDIDNGISVAKQSVQDFLTAVGKTKVSELDPSVLEAFLSPKGYTVPGTSQTYSFLKSFNLTTNSSGTAIDTSADWKATWSNASDEATTSSISKSETIETSVSANDKSFRQMTAAYAMLAAIGGEDVSTDLKKKVTTAAAGLLSTGMAGVTSIRAVVGTRQNRVEAANDALQKQQDVVTKAYTDLEGVDQTEASQRYLALETQLQAAYTITGRIQKLSILDYL